MTPVTWLRISYWSGAIADALIGFLMLVPSRMGETEFRYSMGLAATIAFGWTVLLIWADRKPLERKGILLITIFPVIVGLMTSGIWSVAKGLLTLTHIIPSLILGTGLIALMLFSYVNASRATGRDSQ